MVAGYTEGVGGVSGVEPRTEGGDGKKERKAEGTMLVQGAEVKGVCAQVGYVRPGEIVR